MQRGSSPIFFLLILAMIILIASALVLLNSPLKRSNEEVMQIPTLLEDKKEYANSDLEFKFSYGKELETKEDSEEKFDKRGHGNFRKNFKSYITYEPAKFLGAVALLDETKSYETNPFTIWVFENPQNFSVEDWYKDYWYYPFVWGDYTVRRNNVAPIKDATISGQLAKSGVVFYQPGEPKFIYLSHKGKMYLFRVVGGEGEKILESFKFL